MLYDYANHPLNCIGTIAHIYRPELTEAATELGICIGTILQDTDGRAARRTTVVNEEMSK